MTRVSEGDLDLVGIGSMVVDRIARVPRLLGADEKAVVIPSPDGPPVQEFVGGVVLNQLGWAAALGLRCGIFGRQADDAESRFMKVAMHRLGIEARLDLDGSASSVSQIFVDERGERAIYMAPGATSETHAEHVRRFGDFIGRARRLITEVSQLPLDAVLEALRIAREAGAETAVDLDVPPSDAVPGLGDAATLEEVLRAPDLLKPSKRAARELANAPDADAVTLARALRARFGNRAVVVTHGEQGCAIASDEFEGMVPAHPVKAVDSTGAGDAFLGGLLWGLDAGLDWRDAGRFANACGAACVEKLGAFPDDAEAARSRVIEIYGKPLPLSPVRGRDAGGEGALRVMDVVLDELTALRRRVDPRLFRAAAELVRAAEVGGGRVHVTGIGKPEHVAHYGAALLSSTGTPATFLHGTEVVHGSAGQVVRGDVVIAISNSGETQEMHDAVRTVRSLGARVIVVTGGLDSRLAGMADVVLDASVSQEGGGLGLAPRASVAAEVVVMGALAALLEESRDFDRGDYNARHPSGTLGRRSGQD